jgi:hypothetical protein
MNIANIEMYPVKSENVARIGYDSESKEMYVEFHGGRTYCYKQVSAKEHEALLRAESIGRHLHQFIRPIHAAFML